MKEISQTFQNSKYDIDKMVNDDSLSLPWCSREQNPYIHNLMRKENPELNDEEIRKKMITAYIDLYEKNYADSPSVYKRIAWHPLLTKDDAQVIQTIMKPIVKYQICSLGVSLVALAVFNSQARKLKINVSNSQLFIYSMIPILSLVASSYIGYKKCSKKIKETNLYSKYIVNN